MKINLLFNYPLGDLVAITGVAAYLQAQCPQTTFVVNGSGEFDKRISVNYSILLQKYNTTKEGHYTRALVELIAEQLPEFTIPLPTSPLKPVIDISEAEKGFRPYTEPYWVIFPGGKRDFTAKLWHQDKWNKLVELLQDNRYGICKRVVQVGKEAVGYINPSLKRVTNLINRTSEQELFSLIYHADGVVCGITSGMHIAAAFDKPCVVIAGGREGPWWAKYDNQVFVHTIGKLQCCALPCWNSDVTAGALGKTCLNVVADAVQPQPKCMSLITPEMVVSAILNYYKGKVVDVTIKEEATFVPYEKEAKVNSVRSFDTIAAESHILTDTDIVNILTSSWFDKIFPGQTTRGVTNALHSRYQLLQKLKDPEKCKSCVRRSVEQDIKNVESLIATAFTPYLKTLSDTSKKSLMLYLEGKNKVTKSKIFYSSIGDIL